MEPRTVPAPLRELAANAGALPALIAAGILLALAASEGGYPATARYPASLAFLGLLVVALLVVPARRPPRAVAIAVAGLFAYAAWTYLTILWADQQGDAWDGANRALAYAVLFALLALFPPRQAAAALVLGVLGLGIAAVGAVELVRIAVSDQPATYFIGTRLAEPVGYQNANVALWMLGALPCAVLATRPELPAPLRGLSLAGAGLLAELALLGQSRGWLFALPLALVVLVLVTPRRVQLLAALGAVAAALLAARGPIVELNEEFTLGPRLFELVDDAARPMLISAAALFFAGTAAALLGRLLPRRPGPELRLGRAALAAVTALALAGSAAAFVALDGPATLEDKWEEIKTGPQPGREGRLTGSLGSNRYDFWTVAWERFEERPVAGIGIDNFMQDYLERGSSEELPRYPHSLQIGVLSQTGLVGAVLLFGALAAAGFAAVGAARRRSGLAGAAAGAGLAMSSYWLLHGSVDWLWEFPAVAGTALAGLGLAAGLSAPERGPGPARAPVRGRPAAAVLLALALVAAASFAAPWLAERQVRRAAGEWREAPARALDRLDSAAALNPLSPRPDLVAGSIALRLGDLATARERFERAREREPRNHYAVLESGLISARSGDDARARQLLERARELNPRDPVTQSALKAFNRGRPLDIEALNRRIRETARDRVSAD